MQRLLFLNTVFLVFTNALEAQTVTIPDPVFAAHIETVVPACIAGNQLDTACPDLAGVTILNLSATGVSDLTGIEYFTGLINLQCENNTLLTTIPALPSSLVQLWAGFNGLTSLPALPPNLETLVIWNNNLSALPDLPASLTEMWLDGNMNLGCLPVLPEGFQSFGWGPGVFAVPNTLINCTPNLPPAFAVGLPICFDGDIYNPNNCQQVVTITGRVYQDNIANCVYDSGEPGIYMAKSWLMNSSGDTIASAYSSVDGVYAFLAPPGTYTVALETASAPFQVTCAGGGDSTFTFSTTINEVNFAVECLPGFDVGALSVVPAGFIFPGVSIPIKVYAGDMGVLNNLACAVGVSGQVVIDYSGPMNYVAPLSGSLVPASVVGNTLTYDIADFAAVDFTTAFAFEVLVDTTALAGDTFCIHVDVTPEAGDSNPLNNSITLCGIALNSFDPNIKEVYPVNVDPGYDDWLTYTIHFQNTGTAAAMNIKLRDTLDALLKPNTFELLGTSHPVQVNLTGHNAVFIFDDIMLPDSASDPLGSIGWIQYRVKPEPGLPDGTEINNECYIFFDYNSPILTNTATTSFKVDVDDAGFIENEWAGIVPYPNPSTGVFEMIIPGGMADGAVISICDITGKVMMTHRAINPGILSLDLSQFDDGIYFMMVSDGKHTQTHRLVKY